MISIVFFIFVCLAALAVFSVINSLFVRISSWTKSYKRLADRYGTRVAYSGFRPKLSFVYGKSICFLKNIGRSNNKKSLLQIEWPDRKFKLHLSKTSQVGWFFARMSKIDLDLPNAPFTLYSNDAVAAKEMVNATTVWQIKQIMDLYSSGAEISVESGRMRITKPGFIKNEIQLDDFVRYGLELFDQFRLAVNRELKFLSDDEAVVIAEVTCPICSGKIVENMVTCVRCRTPHCGDCWEYNGQCATFACSEKRCFSVGDGVVEAGRRI